MPLTNPRKQGSVHDQPTEPCIDGHHAKPKRFLRTCVHRLSPQSHHRPRHLHRCHLAHTTCPSTHMPITQRAWHWSLAQNTEHTLHSGSNTLYTMPHSLLC